MKKQIELISKAFDLLSIELSNLNKLDDAEHGSIEQLKKISLSSILIKIQIDLLSAKTQLRNLDKYLN